MRPPAYLLLGRPCTRREYEDFKAKLDVAASFVDERLPAVGPGGVGGHGAIWKAVDPATGARYTINEYMVEGESTCRIDATAEG